MRKLPVLLQIPSPCAQSWADMTPQGAGRHCAACQKVVIDFTQKTDAEILAVLAAASGQTCGRFGASQLGRPLQPAAPAHRAAWWQAAVAATVALLGGRMVVPPAGQAQVAVRQAAVYKPAGAALPARATPTEVERMPEELSPDSVVTGRVLDKATGEGLPGVTILLQGTTTSVSSSSDGTFSLLVAPQDRHRPLEFSSVGYLQLLLAQPATQQPVLAELQGDFKGEVQGIVAGGISYAPSYTPRRLWKRLCSVPYRVKSALKRL